MRSSKSRSRSKSNRSRPTGGNIVNRVFDSSGPEGKVRGTPQQIIEKYSQLTRDAQLSGDRVAAENFAQHAEHYTRMLAEAQREMDQKRDQHDQQQRDRQPNQQNDGGNQGGQRSRSDDDPRDPSRQGDQDSQGGSGDRNRQGDRGDQNRQGARDGQSGGDEPGPDTRSDQSEGEGRKPSRSRGSRSAPRQDPAPREDDVIETGADHDTGLVETPESKPKPRRTRKPRAASPENGQDGNGNGGDGSGESQAAE